MITSDFAAAITDKEYLDGEARHLDQDQSRKLAMAAGLTKSSAELKQAWEKDPELYLVTLKGAIAAYEHNQMVEELLRGAIARLASVIDDADPELLEAVMGIVGTKESDQAS